MYILFAIVFFLILNAYSNEKITQRELIINVLVFTATLLFIRLLKFRFIPATSNRKRNYSSCTRTRKSTCQKGNASRV